jgi:YgiT-type zinc finger domain-containing protein
MAKPYFCGECGEPMKATRGTTHFRESGLDNIVLENVPIWTCKNGHEDVQVPAVDQLCRLIAQLMVTQPWPMKGQDVRFLRKHLGYSGRAFSSLIGINHVTLSKFENDRDRIPRKLEALVRLLVAQILTENTKQPFPRPLIPVLQALESASESLDLRDLRVEHIDLAQPGRIAEPRHAWQEVRP